MKGSIGAFLPIRTILAMLVSVSLTLVVMVVMAEPAWADEPAAQGCQYDDDSIDPISYRFFSVGSDYETAFEDAEEAWDDTAAPGYFSEQSWSLDPEVNVIDGAYSTATWWGRVIYTCASDGTFNGNEVELEFNTHILDDEGSHEKKVIGIHELGHAYGIDDYTGTSCHVMRNSESIFTCGTMPSDHDVDAVDELY